MSNEKSINSSPLRPSITEDVALNTAAILKAQARSKKPFRIIPFIVSRSTTGGILGGALPDGKFSVHVWATNQREAELLFFAQHQGLVAEILSRGDAENISLELSVREISL